LEIEQGLADYLHDYEMKRAAREWVNQFWQRVILKDHPKICIIDVTIVGYAEVE
jgi:hypothetical protein